MAYTIQELQGAAFLPFPDMQGMMESEFSERFKLPAGDLRKQGLARDYGDVLFISREGLSAACPPPAGQPPQPAEPSPQDRQIPAAQPQAAQDRPEALPLPYWCRDRMDTPRLITFDSIKDASDALRSMGRSWAPAGTTLFRRTALIQERLPHVNLKEKNFPFSIPASPIGLYLLTGEHTMLASAGTSSPLPAGTLAFTEDHENPPSRAYLKLQEALCEAAFSFGVPLPGPGSRCFDAGACPGGWTWVLTQLGADVFAVDRAPLDERLMAHPRVEFLKHDAFTLSPEELGDFDWVFSDVICYPERLLGWVERWLASGKTKRMICTIKMQGSVDWELVSRFAAIEDSRVLHLNYNKHELTLIVCQ